MSPMFGIDCEMCKTASGDLELTRVTIVNENMKVISIICLYITKKNVLFSI